MTPFAFGERSRKELIGVHPELVDVCGRAIASSPIDFAVHDGLRTIEEQRRYVEAGVSQTLNSKHLTQADGYGHAVDLVPYVNGKLRWEQGPCLIVARAVYAAAGVEIVWGGVWDRQLDELDPDHLLEEIEAYKARRRAGDRRAFIDLPHFELW